MTSARESNSRYFFLLARFNFLTELDAAELYPRQLRLASG